MRSQIAWVVAIFATFTMTLGCGSGDSDKEKGDKTSGETTSSKSDSRDSSGEKVAYLPMRTDGPNSMDPVQGSSVYDNRASSQVYECLIEYDYLSRPTTARSLRPLLLAELPKISEDRKTYSFKLKEGVKFHDDSCFEGGKGRELKSSDVIYSWKRMADNSNEPNGWWLFDGAIVGFDEFRKEQNAADIFDYDAEVEGFKVINDREFTVTLKQPVYRFMYTLAMFQLSVVPREAVEKYGKKFARHPVGTGPFTLAENEWVPKKSMVLRKNPNYHECFYPEKPAESYDGMDEDVAAGFYKNAGEKLPLLDRVEITMFVQDQPMWLKFRAGDVDYTQVPAENFEEAFNRRTRKLKKSFADDGIDSRPVRLLDFIFYGFNMEDELVGGYGDKKKYLRQAISLALDWDERNDSFYNGINIVYDGMIPPGLDGYPEDGIADVSYRGPDLEKAKELLAKAGYPDGKGLPPIEYYTSRGANNAEQTEMLKRQLARINVKVNSNLVDFSALMEAVDKKKAQVFSFAWGSDYPDGENNLALFYGPNKAPGANHFNYNRPEFDEMYKKIRSMGPSDERTALYEKMRDMVIEDTPYLGAMARTRFYLINPRLKNFKPSEDFYTWVKYMNVE